MHLNTSLKKKDIYKAPIELYRQGPIKVFKTDKSYIAYIAAKKKSINLKKPKKAFIDLLINTIRKPYNSKDQVRPIRPLKIKYDYLLYKMPLY